jgi:hypothetical protein
VPVDDELEPPACPVVPGDGIRRFLPGH